MEGKSHKKKNIFDPPNARGHVDHPACIRDIFLHEDNRKAIFDQIYCQGGERLTAPPTNRKIWMQKSRYGKFDC